jgi:hypothetical protein
MKFRLFGSPIIITRDRRKYPIKRDESGQSARKRAFAAFDESKKPEEVYCNIRISLRTARRYYADWKKLPENFTKNYELQRKLKRRGSPFYDDKTIMMAATELCISEEEVAYYLQQSWGLHKIIRGEFIADQDRKNQLDDAIRKVVLLKVVTAMEVSALPPKDILVLANRLLQEAQEQRGRSNLARKVLSKFFSSNRRRFNIAKR